ncbi:MAG: hypothetical protein AAGI72_15495 [Pseudomonadota bacterium]
MLKLEIDSLEGVEESQRALYKEQEGGGFRLEVEGIEDTGALKRAKDHEKKQRQEAEDRARGLQEKLDAIDKDNKEAKDKNARDKGDVEALEKSWQEKLTNRETELNGKIESLEGSLRTVLVDGKAEALAAELAIDGSAAALLPHIKARLATDMRDGQMTTVVLDKEGKPSALTVDELKKEIAGEKAFAPLIAGSKASGSGASGAGRGGGAASTGNLAGDKKERVAAIKERFPDLP